MSANHSVKTMLAKEPADLMRDYWVGTIEAAQAGDVEAARDVLKDVAGCVEEIAAFRHPERAWRGPIPWAFAQYLAEAFRAILNGADPAKALNLIGRTRGRRKGKSVTHDMGALAAAYYLLIRNGLRAEEANRALERTVGVNRATVHRAREKNEAYRYRKLIEDEILKVVARPYAKHVATILAERRVAQKGENPAADRRRR